MLRFPRFSSTMAIATLNMSAAAGYVSATTSRASPHRVVATATMLNHTLHHTQTSFTFGKCLNAGLGSKSLPFLDVSRRQSTVFQVAKQNSIQHSPARVFSSDLEMVPTAEWTKIPGGGGPVPLARSSHGISCIGNKLYVFAGEHVARVPIGSEMHVLDLGSGKWEDVAVTAGTAPEPRLAHAQAVVGASIYIFGGRSSVAIEDTPLEDLFKFDTDTQSWSEVPVTSGETRPSARSFHQMVAAGNMLYVFGGCGRDGRMADLWAFDLGTGAWKELPAGPFDGRGGASFTASPDGNKLYVIAGFAGREMADAWVFDVASDKWSAMPSEGLRPRSVCGHGTLKDGTIVLFGGEVEESNKGHEGAGGFANDVVLFSESGYVTTIPAPSEGPVPINRGWAATDVSSDGKSLVLHGGLTGNDEAPQRLDDTWVLTIA